MKRLFCIACLTCVFLLVGCTLTTTSALDSTTTTTSNSSTSTSLSTLDPAAAKALFETNFAIYAAKLDELTEGVESIARERPRALEATYPEEFRYVKSDFMGVYETQIGYNTTGYINEILYTYKFMFDLMTECIDFKEIELDEAFHVEYVPEGEVSINIGESFDITLSNLPGNYVRMHFSLFEGTLNETFIVGFDEEHNFVLKDLTATSENNEVLYYYIEFIENHQCVMFSNQGGGDYLFHSISADTGESVDVRYSVLEGYTISLMNPMTNIFATIQLKNGERISEYFQFYVPNSLSFRYSDQVIDDEVVDLSFDLLMTEGWDYAYLPNINNNRTGNAIIKDDVAIFEQGGTTEIFSMLTDYYAHLMVKFEIAKTDISEAVLDLSAYGLEFSDPRVNVETLDGLGDQVLLDAQSMAMYGDLSFLNDQNPVFIDLIDDDLKAYLLP